MREEYNSWPQYIDSDAYETIEVGDEVSSLADFGITIAGDSMEPQFVNGQTVWVHSQERLNVGEIGIFLYEGQAYCKPQPHKQACNTDSAAVLFQAFPAFPLLRRDHPPSAAD